MAQPYYVLLTPELALPKAPAVYSSDKQQYAQILEFGKPTYNSLAEQ